MSWSRIQRAVKAILASRSPAAPVTPTAPAAFLRAPAVPPAPKLRDWRVIDAEQWHVYLAFSPYAWTQNPEKQLSSQKYPEDMEAAANSPTKRLYNRAKNWLRVDNYRMAATACPEAARVFWFWIHQQNGGWYKHGLRDIPIVSEDINGTVVWTSAGPIGVFSPVRGLSAKLGERSAAAPSFNDGLIRIYVTQLKLPNPDWVLDQTYTYSPDLKSRLGQLTFGEMND